MLAGAIAVWPVNSYLLLAVATAFMGLGAGFAMPGYNAGPTLEMNSAEQGSLAGLINANNGATYAIAPVLATALYSWNHYVPFIVIVVLMLIICIFTYVHPRLRS